jgi:hypothetical protein
MREETLDDYAREPGLRDLINNLRKGDEADFHVTTDQRVREIEYRTDVIRGFHQATADYIDQLRAVEDALHATREWENHAVGLLTATSQPIPLVEDKSGQYARIAQEIHEEQHPVLSRIGG